MSQVDKLQEAEEQVAQLREEEARRSRESRAADLRRTPLADTATRAHHAVTAPLTQVGTMANMRVGPLPDVHELAVSIKEAGLLHPPLVRATGDDAQPYELLAGRRRYAAMALLDEAEGPRDDWRFTLVDGISRREALTMQFAENFHQSKPEPVQFARAARAIMQEDPSLTAADVSRMVGAPPAWTRKALRLLDLPEPIVARVEQGDLAFTVADLVRRKIADGAVTPAEAEALVEERAAGRIDGGELKAGIGYVPPRPEGYEEQSRKLDEARWVASRDGRPSQEDRAWEADAGPITAARGPEPSGPSEADLDAYLLSLVLARLAPEGRRAARGITDERSAQRFAFALRPEQRLRTLRLLAAELLAEDGAAPTSLRLMA